MSINIRSSTTTERPDPPGVGAVPTVTIVITTYNHARYLAQAINTALAQTRPADDIIVVDDGSADDPASVVARFPSVRLIRQDNRGLASARNTGLRESRTSYITFLDADDRLLPNAIADGLECAQEHPSCAFVYGGYRLIYDNGQPDGPDHFKPPGPNPFQTFLRGNPIGMHATVLYSRALLQAAGAFDKSLRLCEDYDAYLRIARLYPVAGHPRIVAEYRRHAGNVSNDHARMLAAALSVLDRQRHHVLDNPTALLALRKGKEHWRGWYAGEALSAIRARWSKDHDTRLAARNLVRVFNWSPAVIGRFAAATAWRRSLKYLPVSIVRGVNRWRGRAGPLPLGAVRLGDLNRLSPISRHFGFDRGTPIDRYYIERFLQAHSSDVRGRVLEIGDDAYTRRFGGQNVSQSDILHVDTGNPRATIVGDLSQGGVLPADCFDCIILTQTLHLIFDMRAAISRLHRALRPDGVLLLTVPGITPVDSGEWSRTWYWSLTAQALHRLLGEAFPREAFTVEAHGNVLVATAMIHGLAVEEFDLIALQRDDASYPVIVAARATKVAQR